MFKGSAFSLRFRPENGMTVMAAGRVSVYPRDGKYQLYVTAMMPSGAGDLQLAFEQLKAKLETEGLFDDEHKKPLPKYPGTVAVITSPVGAAVRDMIRILGERWPMANVLVVPTRVQGTEAPGEIREAIEYVNEHSLADVIITGRGGGSIEDLWAFNDESLARAIYASRIPVISAVGHEPDVTISDYVADARASTPSNGAEICVPEKSEIRALVSGYAMRLEHCAERKLERERKNVAAYSQKRVLRDPAETFNLRRMDIDMLRERLVSAESRNTERRTSGLVRLASALDAMSPLKVLGRGYSMASDESGKTIKSVRDVKEGQRFTLRLTDGSALCRAEEISDG